jgi:competence protein ComEC
MSRWSYFPFVRLLGVWILGILMAYYTSIHYGITLLLLLFGFLAYLMLRLLLPKNAYYEASPLLGFLGLSCVGLLGYFCLWLHQAKQVPWHISQQEQAIEAYVAVVQEPPRQGQLNSFQIVSLKQGRILGDWQSIEGKVKLYCKAAPNHFQYGDIVLVLGQPQLIPEPHNPAEFNQKAYLSHQNIYHQHYVKVQNLIRIGNIPPSYVQKILLQLRAYTDSLLSASIPKAQEKAIVLALVLGNKALLTEDLKAAYGRAGAMHVLAVSGLHVGIVYGLLHRLLHRLYKKRWAKWAVGSFNILCLWSYAGITGLAPSVLRATLMFTLVAIAKLLNKQHHIYNSLAASAFVLLLSNPLLIVSVGFQLSYCAVLGIVYLQPKIARWFKFQNRLPQYLWLASSISLAAQLATSPLSIYYFHQFPFYFLVANWVVVPAAFMILSLGLAVLLTSWLPWICKILAFLLEHITYITNRFVFWISSLPNSVWQGLYLEKLSLFLVYAFLISVISFLHKKKFQDLVIASILALFLSVVAIKPIIHQRFQKGLTIYAIKHHTALALIRGMHSWLVLDQLWPNYLKQYAYHIQPNQLARGISHVVAYTYQNAAEQADFPWTLWQGLQIGVWQQKRIIIIDQASLPYLASIPPIKTHFLLLEQDAIKNLQPLLAKFQFDSLIIGSSNSLKRAAQLQQEAVMYGLKPHHVQQQGAFMSFW